MMEHRRKAIDQEKGEEDGKFLLDQKAKDEEQKA